MNVKNPINKFLKHISEVIKPCATNSVLNQSDILYAVMP